MHLKPHVTLTDTDTGAVLLDGRTGKYFELNSTAQAVLHALLAEDGPNPIELLLERFEVTRERAVADVNALQSKLSQADLVETA